MTTTNCTLFDDVVYGVNNPYNTAEIKNVYHLMVEIGLVDILDVGDADEDTSAPSHL